jgi:hypothetical protein
MRILALLAVLATAPLALAGDRSPLAGCDCAHECPLAQAVHAHRSWGEEAVATSKTVRAEFVKTVVANLGSI